MKALSRDEIQTLVGRIETSALDIDSWNKLYDEFSTKNATLSFPLGEIQNPKLSWYMKTWKSKMIIEDQGFEETDSVKTMPLEGKASVSLCLIDAILAYQEFDEMRCVIHV
ncbi:MAG: hypothetical protein M0R48_11790 [Candidatus Omnitrophica bacterium]|nr:hypothetical protein [Candidatus Omnitrophota bacterium]